MVARSAAGAGYLIRKLSLVSLVPFISSRIHTGVMPLPVHLRDLFFFDWYFGFGFARLPALPLPGVTALTAADAFFDTWPPSCASWDSKYERCSLTLLAST